MTVVSEEFKAEATSVEPWYKTKYRCLNLSEAQIATWTRPAPNTALFLPAANIFIPENFDLRDRSSLPGPSKFPTIVYTSPIVRVWQKLDDTFLKPKVNICA